MGYSKLYDKLPSPNEPITIDTQILYWLFYADNIIYLDRDRPYQIPMYSNYLEKIMGNGNNIIVYGGVILELFKIIEINEYQLYLEMNGIEKTSMSIKEYRKIEREREIVQKQIQLTIKQIEQIATICYKAIDKECSDSYINEFNNHRADFVDFSLVYFCKANNVNNILTDDGDFKTISTNINIISGNKVYFDKKN